MRRHWGPVALLVAVLATLAALAAAPASGVGDSACGWHSNDGGYWYAFLNDHVEPPVTQDDAVKADHNGDGTVCQLWDGTQFTKRLHDNTK